MTSALLVGDNRTGNNWGGRGVSLALRSLLGTVFNIESEIEGREFLLDFAGYGYVGTLLPARFDHLFMHAWQQRATRRLFDRYVKFEEAYGAHDYVAVDAAETVEAMHRYRTTVPEIGAILDKVESAEVVVVNGEGEFVFTTPPRRAVLLRHALMEYAYRLGKPVFFVNAMLSDCPFTGRHTRTAEETRRQLARCAGVFLRDHASIALAAQLMPEVTCEFVPDALFEWQPRVMQLASQLPADGDLFLPHPEEQDWFGRLDFSKPYICVGGNAAAGLDHARAANAYTVVVEGLQRLGLPVYLMENDGRDAYLRDVARRTGAGFLPVWAPIMSAAAILSRAALFVSGRYHPSILASLGGTPCVFLGTTAHKTGSLAAVLEYDESRTFSVFPDAGETREIVELGRDLLGQGATLRERLIGAARRRWSEVVTLPQRLTKRLSQSPGAPSTARPSGHEARA